MVNIDIANLLRQRQDEFVEKRTIIESEINKFLDSIAQLDPDVRTRCGYVPEAKAKSLVPELWNEPFRPEVYEQQLAGVLAYIKQVTAVCDEINREAQACLQG